MQLLLGEFADRLVRVEVAAATEDAAVPTVHAVAGDRQRTLVERLAVVVQLGQVEVVHRAPALAARAHAAGDAELAALPHGLSAALHRDRARAADRGDIERERLGRADVRLPEPAEEDAQHRVGVGGRADRGAGVGAHPLLVNDDRGGQPFEDVDLGPGQRRHEALHEGAVRLVDHPLRLCGDRAEHQRALARARDAGEHRQAALRDLDADVFEVVHARALHTDQIVAVGSVQRKRRRVRPRGNAHRVSICEAAPRGRHGRSLSHRRRQQRIIGGAPRGWRDAPQQPSAPCLESTPGSHSMSGVSPPRHLTTYGSTNRYRPVNRSKAGRQRKTQVAGSPVRRNSR